MFSGFASAEKNFLRAISAILSDSKTGGVKSLRKDGGLLVRHSRLDAASAPQNERGKGMGMKKINRGFVSPLQIAIKQHVECIAVHLGFQ